MCRKADLVLVLKEGRMVEQGTYDKLVRQQGVFYDMFRTQIETMERETPEEGKEEEREVAVAVA
jgi:ATP-binding cassette subfamily B protein